MQIVIINPNSDEAMTKDIDKAARSYAEGRFEVMTLPAAGAPKFIDTFEDQALSAPGMVQIVRKYEKEADAFVVACACDPNLKLMREISSKPVVGIGEASMYMATMLGNSFTILQTDTYSVPNKVRLVHQYQMAANLASVRAALKGGEGRFEQYLEAARCAIDEDGAEVIILGCAGLCDMSRKLSRVLGMPVLDGIACALAMAEGFVRMECATSKVRYYSGGHNG